MVTYGTVFDDVPVRLYEETGDDCVSIFFGEEQLGLDFYDPEMLDRVAAVATEGARVLRAKIAASAADEPGEDDRPVELAG